MDKVIASLNRIEGQIRGIRKMYEEERACEEIAQQISAVQSALRRVGKEILTDEALRCSKGKNPQKEMERVIASLIKIS